MASIYIKGLTQKTTESDIAKFIEQKVGPLEAVTNFKDGIEFSVTFESAEKASTATSKLNGQSFRGDSLLVSNMGEAVGKVEEVDKSVESKLVEIFAMMNNSKKAEMLKILSASVDASSSQGNSSGNSLIGSHAAENVKYVRLDTPRLPNFSGNTKGETKYAQWRYEIECLATDQTLSEQAIWQAVRRSVKGAAAEVLISMGTNSTINELLERFDVRFGNAQSLEQLLQEFYTAAQQQSESVVDWGCRLEEMMSLIREVANFTPETRSEMIRGKFWSGLKSEYIKAALRHRFDSKEPLEALIKKARVVEKELVKPNSQPQVSQHSVGEESLSKKLDDILKQMRTLDGRVQKIERQNADGITISHDNVGTRNQAGLGRPDRQYNTSGTTNAVGMYGMPQSTTFPGDHSSNFRGGRTRPRGRGVPSQRCCYVCGDPTHLSYYHLN